MKSGVRLFGFHSRELTKGAVSWRGGSAATEPKGSDMQRLWQGQSTAALVVAMLALALAAVGPANALEPGKVALSKVSRALGLAKKASKNARQAKRIAKRANRRSKRVSARVGPQGPRGEQGPRGDAGSPDSPAQVLDKLTQVDGAGSQLDSDRLDGVDSAELFRYGSTIPSGATVTGLFYGGVRPDVGSHVRDYQLSESFPLPAPADVTDVNFAPDGFATTTDDDPTCTGSSTNPTAPPGKVCLYIRGSGGSTATAYGTTLNGAERFGFGVNVTGTGGNSFVAIFGIWAYTAP
jgi:hypothetical protein